MFSSRLGQTAGRNLLAGALEQRRAAGLPISDLTLSNPTRAGFTYPPAILACLSRAQGLCYEPDPLGLPAARQAVSEDFSRRGVSVPANRTVLTASTSDAYSLLFKLLCDPGDSVVAPQPSYPLIEHLTALDAVTLEHYRVEFHGRWEVDLEELREKARIRRVRAIVMINPNNPTGSGVTEHELNAVGAIAADHGLAIISDEVFSDYAIAPMAPVSALRQEHALTFALGGLSKSAGLPQVKLGWIAIGGPPPLVDEALQRLETMCDAYLSVSTPVQIAAPDLLKAGATVRAQIQQRVRENYRRLRAAAAGNPACAVLPVEAGWYAVVQIPAVASEETFVVELLEQAGVLVHPGYFYDFDREAFLVVSLLPEPDVFAFAIEAVFQHASTRR
jgi:aspartate/methionine/tyrosine aminotransferase